MYICFVGRSPISLNIFRTQYDVRRALDVVLAMIRELAFGVKGEVFRNAKAVLVNPDLKQTLPKSIRSKLSILRKGSNPCQVEMPP